MKKAFLFLLLLIVGLVVLDHWRDHQHDNDTYLQQLQHRMECANWLIYTDSAYGYGMRYPSCFQQAQTDSDERCRFVYMEDVSPLQSVCYITLDVTTEVCQDSLNPYKEIREMAAQMGAVSLRQSDGCYLMSGTLKSRDPRVTAFRFNAKYVLRQQLWFVQTLIYPEDFAPALQRLVREVDEWEPFLTP